jgi:hypothetical protein
MSVGPGPSLCVVLTNPTLGEAFVYPSLSDPLAVVPGAGGIPLSFLPRPPLTALGVDAWGLDPVIGVSSPAEARFYHGGRLWSRVMHTRNDLVLHTKPRVNERRRIRDP